MSPLVDALRSVLQQDHHRLAGTNMTDRGDLQLSFVPLQCCLHMMGLEKFPVHVIHLMLYAISPCKYREVK